MIKTGCKFLILTFLFSVLFTNTIEGQNGVVTVNQDKEIETLLRLKKDAPKIGDNFSIYES